MKRFFALLALGYWCTSASAGLHYSGESFRELPAQWRGFLPDLRALRIVSAPQLAGGAISPLRDSHAEAALRLETLSRSRALTAEESADLGALYVRLGKPQQALGILRPAARQHPEHFRIAANLGTAWQLSGDGNQAAAALEEAVRLAPERWREFEKYHLKLVRLRIQEGSALKDFREPDNLFGVRFVGDDGKPLPGGIAKEQRDKLPANAVSVVQQLALWLPADGRILWLLGELTNAYGDVRTAANILDGCVTEFAMNAADLRARRTLYRATADERDKKQEHLTTSGISFKSSRALVRALDPARLPTIDPDGVNALPWVVLGETELGAKGKPTFLKYVENLDGKRVVLAGYMAPLSNAEAQLAVFLMTENPVGCWFCEVPGPTQVVMIELPEGATAEITRAAIKVSGTLKLNRTDPERFLFSIVNARVMPAD